MAIRSLLRRVRSPERAGPQHGVTADDVREAVLENLRGMCTSMVGGSPACPGYGMVAVSDVVHSCPDSLATVARTMRQSIEAFEPRLGNVAVRSLPKAPGEELVLRFEVTADLITPDRRVPVSFTTVVDAGRRVTVS